MFVTYWGSPPGVKRPERKVNHSPPSTIEVKNEWSSTSSLPISIHVVERENFKFVPSRM